ncbi:MAG: hypothetical protein ACH346_05510 [Chthoniobacterales bacterium]
MEFFCEKSGDVGFKNIDPFLARLISIPFGVQSEEWITLCDELLSSRCKEDLEFTSDWKEYVEPGIISLLASCHDMVISDLSKMECSSAHAPEKQLFALTIPKDHREAWLRMLNVARLSLAAKHQFSSQEINEQKICSVSLPRREALLQMQLFSMMQQCLIEVEEDLT